MTTAGGGGQQRRLARLALAIPMLVSGATRAGPRASPGTAQSTDISFSDGPGVPAALFSLRGSTLMLLLAAGEDGGPAGLFEVDLPKRDPLFSALAALPRAVPGPQPAPDMPTVRFVLRGQGPTGRERELLVARPTSDPRVDKVLRELARCEQILRAHPVMTLALELHPAPVGGKPKPAGGAQAFVARIRGQGDRSAQATLRLDAIALQAAAEPAPPQPGVTPLPPEWDPVSDPAAGARPQALRAGASLDTKLTVNAPAPEPRRVRAIFSGSVGLRTRDLSESIPVSLSSKAIPLPGVPARAAP